MAASPEVATGKVIYGLIRAFFEDLWNNRDKLGKKSIDLLERLRKTSGENKKEEEIGRAITEEPEAIEEIFKFISEETPHRMFEMLAKLREGLHVCKEAFTSLEDFVKEVLRKMGWARIEFQSNPFSSASVLSRLETLCDHEGFFFSIDDLRCSIEIKGRTATLSIPDIHAAEQFMKSMRHDVEYVKDAMAARVFGGPTEIAHLHEDLDVEAFTKFMVEVLEEVHRRLSEVEQKEIKYVNRLREITDQLRKLESTEETSS